MSYADGTYGRTYVRTMEIIVLDNQLDVLQCTCLVVNAISAYIGVNGSTHCKIRKKT